MENLRYERSKSRSIKGLTLLQGNSIDRLKELESRSVQMCITSPPYYKLRDYELEGQIGLEQTPDLYVEKLVEVFSEVKRILKDDGLLWVNIGDSYASASRGASGRGGEIKPKDLIGIPWMLAFSLRRDGWFLRSDVIWVKPNSVPESVKDRPSKCYEHIFMLSKNQNYYFDYEAIEEDAVTNLENRTLERGSQGYAAAMAGAEGSPQRGNINGYGYSSEGKRRRRDVWTIVSAKYPRAHFSTFPRQIVEIPIQCSSKVGDVVLDPFIGVGTTALVGLELGRQVIGIDLSQQYLDWAIDRIEGI